MDEPLPPRCSRCIYQPTSWADADRHIQSAHSTSSAPAPAAPQRVTRGSKISEVGDRTAAGLACPKCGGTAFKVKRSATRKIGALVALPVTGAASAALLAKGTQVRCVTCATVYKRG